MTCQKVYFNDPLMNNEEPARRCAEEKTNETGIPHIAVLDEDNMVLTDTFRVEVAGPIARMWHVLDGLAARRDPRVKLDSSEGDIFYSVDVLARKELCGAQLDLYPPFCSEVKVPAQLQFYRFSEKRGYDQYQAVIVSNKELARWMSDELNCFGSSDKMFNQKAVIGAMQTYDVCPTAEEIEALRPFLVNTPFSCLLPSF